MNLKTVLSQKEDVILKRWINTVLDTYHPDTKKFLQRNHDPFTNPVGHTLFKETRNLFRELLNSQDTDSDRLTPILDRIIRVRAIQDFSPSQSIYFLFTLKAVIEEEVADELQNREQCDDLLKFEAKIDKAALIAFDIYMECREKIYEITADHAKKQVSGLLRKKGLISEIPEWDPLKKEGNL